METARGSNCRGWRTASPGVSRKLIISLDSSRRCWRLAPHGRVLNERPAAPHDHRYLTYGPARYKPRRRRRTSSSRAEMLLADRAGITRWTTSSAISCAAFVVERCSSRTLFARGHKVRGLASHPLALRRVVGACLVVSPSPMLCLDWWQPDGEGGLIGHLLLTLRTCDASTAVFWYHHVRPDVYSYWWVFPPFVASQQQQHHGRRGGVGQFVQPHAVDGSRQPTLFSGQCSRDDSASPCVLAACPRL